MAVAAALGIGAASQRFGGTYDCMEMFSKALLPVLAAAVAASGSPGASAMRQVATMFAADLLLTVGDRLLLPLIYGYAAVSFVSAAA